MKLQDRNTRACRWIATAALLAGALGCNYDYNNPVEKCDHLCGGSKDLGPARADVAEEAGKTADGNNAQVADGSSGSRDGTAGQGGSGGLQDGGGGAAKDGALTLIDAPPSPGDAASERGVVRGTGGRAGAGGGAGTGGGAGGRAGAGGATATGGATTSGSCDGGANPCGTPADRVGNPLLGLNTLWANSWYPVVPFANVFMSARPPNAYNAWDTPVAKDADGNPTADFSIVIYEGSQMAPFAGAYKLRFTGRADLDGQAVTFRNKAYDQLANVTTADVDVDPASGNPWIHFRNTRRLAGDTTATGLTGLYLMYPGTSYDIDVVTPHFRAATAMFGIIRPMQAMIPNNPMRKWPERSRPRGGGNRDGGDQSYTNERQTGLPFELLVTMANSLNKDLWLNVPYYLDADGQTKLAQLLEYGSDGDLPFSGPYGSKLDATTNPRPAPNDPATWHPGITSWFPPLRVGLHVYVELSNELWNFAAGYLGSALQDDAVAEYNNGDAYHYGTLNGSNPGYLRLARQGRLHKELSERFLAVVGPGGWGDRYRMVLAGQIDWPAVYQGEMLYLATVYGGHKNAEGGLGPLVTAEDGTTNSFGNPAWPVSRWVHYLAGAPYITGADATAQAATLKRETEGYIDALKATCDQHGVKMIAYEGGTDKAAGSRDPGLRSVVRDELRYWLGKAPDAPFVYFGLAENGGFELGPTVFDIDPASWPKWAGIKDVFDELAVK